MAECDCVIYTPNPNRTAPPPDPCDTEAVRQGKQTQPLPCLGLTDTLIAYWDMDEASNTVRQDSVDAHHLAQRGVTQNFAGVISNAARFIAYPDGLFNGDAALAPGSGSFTVAGWVLLQSLSTNMTLWGKSDFPARNGFSFQFDTATGKFVFYRYNSTLMNTRTVIWPTVLADFTWYYVATGYDASTTEIFISVNAATKQTTAATTPQTDTANAFEVGFETGFNDADARIDEVGYWKGSALSAGAIAFLYNSGAGKTYPFSL